MKSTTGKVLNQAALLLVCTLLVVVGWIALRRNAPPLKIVQNGSKLIVDVSTLGEYPTTVTRVRLSDAKIHSVVWELCADGVAQLRELTLVAGTNPARLDPDCGLSSDNSLGLNFVSSG